MFSSLAQTLVAAGVGAFLANIIAELIKGQVRKSQSQEAARDEDLGSLVKIVTELQDLATEYWSQSGEELAGKEVLVRAQIVARQQHLLELISHLFTGQPKRECDVEVTRLLDAIGGDDFGVPDREAQPERLAAVYQRSLSFTHLAKRTRRGLRRNLLA
ncbi:hypothetical protein AB4Z34_05280 [Ensifer sp. 2YAB10]|uniref:hypothetical protein n=1 Tax=unclassified Ensifer TaxID=2633371 RepID=UPI003F929D3A